MELRCLRESDALAVLPWRAKVPETLRTVRAVTPDEQRDWYFEQIGNRESHTRYWGLHEDGKFVGYGGIEHIEWENRRGELSVLIDPALHHKGYGRRAVRLFLWEAFETFNLEHVWGECYTCGAVGFWEKIIKEYGAFATMLPARKYWKGMYWSSYYFDISRTQWAGAGPGSREEANA